MTMRFGGRRFTYHALFEPRLALVLTSAADRQAWRLAHAKRSGSNSSCFGMTCPRSRDGLTNGGCWPRRSTRSQCRGVVWFEATLKADGDMIEIRSVGHEPLR